MKYFLPGLAISALFLVAASGTRTRDAANVNGPIKKGKIKAVALTADECTTLGGAVGEDTRCGGTGGKVCSVTSPDYKGQLHTRYLCIAK